MSPCLLIFEDIDTVVTDSTRSYFFNEVDVSGPFPLPLLSARGPLVPARMEHRNPLSRLWSGKSEYKKNELLHDGSQIR